MSLGYGASDVLALLRIANRIREIYVESPEQFRALHSEVSSMVVVLQATESLLTQRRLNEWQKASLEPILRECRDTLSALDRILEQNSCLESSIANGLQQRAYRAWRRVRWDEREVQELRSRLSLSIGLLGVFNGNLNSQISFTNMKSLESINERQQVQEHENEKKIILDWLSRKDFDSQHADIIRKRQLGTGQWLLKSMEFQNWIDGTNQTLFCQGIPGAGKTIMAAIVVDDLHARFEEDPGIGIIYNYCSFRASETDEIILLGLLKQLVQKHSSIPDEVRYFHRRYTTYPGDLRTSDVARVFKAVAHSYERIFLVVDALDEIQPESSRVKFLSAIFQLQEHTKMSIFATSRWIPDISSMFKCDVRMEIRASDEDVGMFLDSCFAEFPSFIRSSPSLQADIKRQIIKSVDGMFLLAQLHVQSLAQKRSPKAVRIALEQLPSGSGAYDTAYEEAMERINSQGADYASLAKEVISWIVCCRHILTAEEIQQAIAIEVGQPDIDQENLSPVENLVSVCAGLVVVDECSNVMRLVHYTVQEYFNRTRDRWFPNIEADIAVACLTYLSFNPLQIRQPQDCSFPLGKYAANFWGFHARTASHGTTNDNLDQLVIEFLENDLHVQTCVRLQSHPPFYWNLVGTRNDKALNCLPQDRGLHLAAMFDLDKTLQTLIDHGDDPNTRGDFDCTPLIRAAIAGSLAAVDVLLKCDPVDLNAQDKVGRTALIQAARHSNLDVVARLLKTGNVDANQRDSYGRTALFHTARDGEEKILKVLLSDIAVDPNAEDSYRSTPLSFAVRKGHKQCVELLLSKPNVCFTSKDVFGRGPLFWATLQGYHSIENLLLEAYSTAGIRVCAEDTTVQASRSSTAGGHIHCDVCDMGMPDSERHYHCNLCHDDDFDLCQDCFKRGATCLNTSHKLILRSMEEMVDLVEKNFRWASKQQLQLPIESDETYDGIAIC